MIKSVMARDGASSSRRSNFTEPPPMKLSERLEYRLPCTREVLRALQDENINLISVNCGEIKSGDTATTKEFMERVKQQGLFEEVVMTVVSLDPNLRRIQDEIADNLQVKLGNGSLFERAKVLRARMSRDSRRLLVVFLDVREMLDLESIGIPYGSPNGKCKILIFFCNFPSNQIFSGNKHTNKANDKEIKQLEGNQRCKKRKTHRIRRACRHWQICRSVRRRLHVWN